MKKAATLHRFIDFNSQISLIGLQSGLLAMLIGLKYCVDKPENVNYMLLIFGLLINTMMLSQNYHQHNSIQRLKFGALFTIPCTLLFTLATLISNSILFTTLVFSCLVPFAFILDGSVLIKSFAFYLVYAFILGLGFHFDVDKTLEVASYFFSGAISIVIGGYLRILVRKYFLNLNETILYIQHKKILLPKSSNIKFIFIVTGLIISCNFISLYFSVPHGYWLPMTALLVIRNDHQITIERSRHRIIGSIIGVILALSLLALSEKYILAFLLFPLFYLMVVTINRHYALFCVIITLLVMDLINLGTQSSLSILVVRLFATIFAVCIVAVIAIACKNWEDKSNLKEK